MFALLLDNQVIQIEKETFPVAAGLEWVEIAGKENAEVGSTYNADTETFQDRAVETATSKTDLVDTVIQFNLGNISKEVLQTVYENYQGKAKSINRGES